MSSELEIVVDYEDRLVNLTQTGYDLGVRVGDLKNSNLKARKFVIAHAWCCSPTMRQITACRKAADDNVQNFRIFRIDGFFIQ
jgi:hypothetical protein